MENNDTNFIGNISTIVKYVSMLISGWFIGLLVSHGLNLPIGTEELSQVITAIIFLILAHIDATHPNNIWNKYSLQPPEDNLENEDDLDEF